MTHADHGRVPVPAADGHDLEHHRVGSFTVREREVFPEGARRVPRLVDDDRGHLAGSCADRGAHVGPAPQPLRQERTQYNFKC